RTQQALNFMWKYTDEMFITDEIEEQLAQQHIAVRGKDLKEEYLNSVTVIIQQATLALPVHASYIYKGGRYGKHTEELGHLLSEMQIVARSHPNIVW
ncbi:MAG: phenylacetate-CoA oxygenase subunit PaaI, partial [Bacteroidota bacterium]|nr:phenylacetate-CoA oxygenase subunit PaaI [Bacteroidota bacterium]